METDPEKPAKLREQLFITLYKQCFPGLARYVKKQGGDFEQARDVFQEALLVYYEKRATAAGPSPADEKAYVFGIARHIWLRQAKQASKEIPLGDRFYEEETAAAPSQDKVLHYLETAGKRCMELLRAFYYDNTGLEEIARHFGFSGIRSATVQKYKCLEKVRESIKERSLVYEDFLD